MSLLGQFGAVYNILLLVTVISLVTKRFGLPSAITFIFAGVMSTILSSFPLPSLSPEIFTSILLPPIVFHEALRLDIGGLIDESDSVLTYALAGTLLMLAAVALFMNLFLGLSIVEALLLGIIIAPTDPVSIINIFQNMGVEKRFRLIVCGESLFNDGVAIAMHSIIMASIALGAITVFDVVKISLVSILGGVLLGLAFGYSAHTLFCWTDDKFTKVLVSFLIAFGVFRVSEVAGASGVIAVVTTGLIINYRTHAFGGLGRESIEMLEALWEFVGFAASSIAFIFIGMNLNISVLSSNFYPVLYLFAFVLVSRFLMVFGLAELIERQGGREIPRSWRLGLSWSGLRGAVSVVLALGVSSLALPHSEVIIALTFGVVLISNIVQGLSISEIIKRWGLSARSEDLTKEIEGEGPPQWMTDEYSPDSFETGKPFAEKVVFSAPEYFMFETRLGGWTVLRLEQALEFIDDYTTSRMPKTSGGSLRGAFEISAYLIKGALNRMIRARRNYYFKKAGEEFGYLRVDSRYQIRKRRLNFPRGARDDSDSSSR
ncbi:MAG: sodium:proton antiporter [Candidatus Bathyarchaeota archaeon]|nr:sodium:proton antiporter [Candidatus Bathyarchaeota archaeon]